ncbi:hypothetical protein [Variovorax sp.]|uniref:hypothetical protein n=1 Tax=Variovorax sp. TaxID=1871043 RepID=UPI003BA8F860
MTKTHQSNVVRAHSLARATVKDSPRPLPNSIKSQINRLAHAAGLRHETTTRQSLIDDLQRLASAGADLKTLENHLENLESTS